MDCERNGATQEREREKVFEREENQYERNKEIASLLEWEKEKDLLEWKAKGKKKVRNEMGKWIRPELEGVYY